MSTDKQDEKHQYPDCMRAVKNHGWCLIDVVQEQASTGARRPVFDAVVERAKRREFDVLVVWNLSRFGRSVFGNVALIQQLDHAGVRLHPVHQSFLDQPPGPMRDLVFTILSYIAQLQKQDIVDATLSGMAAAKRAGKHVGRPRASIPHTTIELAAQRMRQGESVHAIAASLRVGYGTLWRKLQQRKKERLASLSRR